MTGYVEPVGGLAAPSIVGTEGDDSLVGTSGADNIVALGGDDTIVGGPGDDTIDGGTGFDIVSFAEASGPIGAFIAGGSSTGADGHDEYTSIEGFIGSAFSDVINLYDPPGYADGGAGDDTISGGYGDATIVGGLGKDLLYAGNGRTLVEGGEGDDTLSGAADPHGRITLSGGEGDDLIHFETGDIKLDGGAGTDFLQLDFLGAGVGVNLSLGSARAQVVGDGSIIMRGIEGLGATGFDDVIKGGAAGNVVLAGGGDDHVSGKDGGDRLAGGDGYDLLIGGKGDDTLSGGGQADTMTGGAGSDDFVFHALTDSTGSDLDLIRDLADADLIDLSDIDANALKGGDQAFQLVDHLDGHPGEVAMLANDKHNYTLMVLDVNGDGVADMEVKITGLHADFTDFVL